MEDALFLALKDLILEKHSTDTLEVFLLGRLIQENRIRKIKRMGQPCPFEQDGSCGRIDLRCGERQQFTLPETEESRQKPHQCNYKTELGVYRCGVLIVEDESDLRELYRQYFIRNGVAPETIESAEGVAQAREFLRKARMDNRTYGIVLSDIRLMDGNGFDLVHYLVERNYNCRIILISGYYRPKDLPGNFVGDHEIVSGRRVVSAFARKPVAMKEFEAIVGRIQREFRPV